MMSKYLSSREVLISGLQYSQTCDVQLIHLHGVGRVALRPNHNIHPPSNETSLDISVIIHKTPRSVTFAVPNGLLNDHPNIDGDGDFEYLQGQEVKNKSFNMRVKGNGTLTIESVGELGSQSFKIQLRLKCDEFVLLALPQELNESFGICGDGDIHFTTHFEDELSGDVDLSQVDVITTTKATVASLGVSERGRNHGHKRNGSDYLQITGSNEHIPLESDLKYELQDGSYETSDEQIRECLCEVWGGTIDKVENDAVFKTVSKSAVMCQERTRRINYDGCKCNVLSGMSPKERIRDGELTKGYDDFRNSVIRSNSGRKPWYEGACLKCAIRYHFTFLLHKLILPELCDHLYEKGIINIYYYNDLIEWCLQNRVLEAKRSVLVHLSTGNVCHDDFLQVLYDSSMYRLVPYFYPGVHI